MSQNLRWLSADRIYDGKGGRLDGHAIGVDNKGIIRDIKKLKSLDPVLVDSNEGVMIPGLVNTHCHLELSHMKGRVETGTGLTDFILKVVQERESEPGEVLECIARADKEMEEAGIVAVGDICNTADTADTKRTSRMRYYNFVELFDLFQDGIRESNWNKALEVMKTLSADSRAGCSFVPHASYSVSDELFRRIQDVNDRKGPVSIHNQETPDEDVFCLRFEGDLARFYHTLQLSVASDQVPGMPSLPWSLKHLSPHRNSLLVHNTMTTSEDVSMALSWSDRVFWVSCPNANLYIENRLPEYKALLSANAKMCLGTDSLSSNWQLSILEEMKTVHRFNSWISFEEMVVWACSNGAQALEMDESIGSLEVGKQPGICLLTSVTGLPEELGNDIRLRRIA